MIEEAFVYNFVPKISTDYWISRDEIGRDRRGPMHRCLSKIYKTLMIG